MLSLRFRSRAALAAILVLSATLAVAKSDRPAAMEAHKRLMQSCNGCHYGGPPLKEK